MYEGYGRNAVRESSYELYDRRMRDFSYAEEDIYGV
jgi:hypothetical protein